MRLLVTLLAGGSLISWSQTPLTFSESDRRIIAQFQLPEPPPDPTNTFADHPGAVHLGQYLFFETRLSANNTIACATCHAPEKGFADQRPLAMGLSELTRHSQSLWQVAYQRWFFWDGRIDTLWGQALQPLEDPREMGSSRLEVFHFMARDPSLRQAYESIFGALPAAEQLDRFPPSGRPVPDQPEHPQHQLWQELSSVDQEVVNRVFVNVGKALAAFQRRLISRDSPFDQFAMALLKGEDVDPSTFSPKAQRGLKLFIGKAQCRACHSGPNFSDGEFHNNGVPPLQGGIPKDAGRWEGIAALQRDPFHSGGLFSDDPNGPKAKASAGLVRTTDQWGQFKTPSLRNVAQSAPYMHQGQLATLDAVIAFYADLRDGILAGHHREPLLQPLELSPEERGDLVAFLESLTGQPLPPEMLKKPPSPWLAQP